MDFHNKSNFSNLTDVGTSVDATDVGNLVLSIVILLTVFCCWILNTIVAIAVTKTKENKLKVKFLILNGVIADVLLSVAFALLQVFAFLEIGDNRYKSPMTSLCARVVLDWFMYFATFYQIFSTMAPAFDRFNSIAKPLSYHTTMYTKAKKTFVLATLIGLAMALSLPMTLLKIKPDEPIAELCLSAGEKGPYTQNILPFVILGAVSLTFLTSCGILVAIAYHRSRKSLTQSKMSISSRKRQISLAVTFFLTNFTCAFLYIPGALYFSVIGETLSAFPEVNRYLPRTAMLLYIMNTAIDPMIYIYRIRSVKEIVQRMCCRKENDKLAGNDTAARTKECQVQSISASTDASVMS